MIKKDRIDMYIWIAYEKALKCNENIERRKSMENQYFRSDFAYFLHKELYKDMKIICKKLGELHELIDLEELND